MRHTLDRIAVHYQWNRSLPPALRIASGDEVSFIIGDPTVPHPSMPLSGPVAVDGAEPGDALEVEIVEVQPADRGYTAIDPGVGLLADEFPEPFRHEWDLGRGDVAVFRPGVEVPIAPFLGLIGVAPAEYQPAGSIPPGRHGGNVDIRQLTAGATLWLPVLSSGALLSAGDMHAAQGDGEVCGTAIETFGSAVLRITLRKDMPIASPQFRTPGPMEAASLRGPWHGTTGIGPDLMSAARDAIRAMIGHLEREHKLTRAEAYALCSIAVDLRIAEIVDKPNWVVTACLPLTIFGDRTRVLAHPEGNGKSRRAQAASERSRQLGK